MEKERKKSKKEEREIEEEYLLLFLFSTRSPKVFFVVIHLGKLLFIFDVVDPCAQQKTKRHYQMEIWFCR